MSLALARAIKTILELDLTTVQRARFEALRDTVIFTRGDEAVEAVALVRNEISGIVDPEIREAAYREMGAAL